MKSSKSDSVFSDKSSIKDFDKDIKAVNAGMDIIDEALDIAPLNQIKVISYKDKSNWILETKYNIGKKKAPED